MKKRFRKCEKLYHFTKFDTAILILESQCLRFGRLNDMNDIHENDKLSFVDVSRNQINDFPSNLLTVIDDEIAKYRQISFTIDDEKHKKRGFDLHQMWGLYADKGQGVCLVFDKKILCKQLDGTILHNAVLYDNTVDSFYIAPSQNAQNIQQGIQLNSDKLFFHKRKEWEHEQEYRLIKRCPSQKKEEYHNYGKALKYIILSSKIEDVDCVKFKKMEEKLKRLAPKVPILVYGNGLLEYTLLDIAHNEIIWSSSQDYDISIPGENCEITE